MHYLATNWTNDPLDEGLYAYLEVTDSGCGMATEQLAKICARALTDAFASDRIGDNV